MRPKIIVHNSISLDGSLLNFEVNMDLHYRLAGCYNPDAHLIGSNTIKTGVSLYGSSPPEEKQDFHKPKRMDNVPYWVIPDTKGILKGMLHEIRRFDFCKDLIVLVYETTPKEYIKYLKDREYDYHIVGSNHIALEPSLKLLYDRYGIATLLTDTGKILVNLLINQGFVDEISLLIHPVIVGKTAYNIFSDINPNIRLKLMKHEILDEGCIWLVYKVLKI